MVFTPQLAQEARNNPCVIPEEVKDTETMEAIFTSWLSDWEDKARKTVNKSVKPFEQPWYTKHLSDLKDRFLKAADSELRKKLRTRYLNATRAAKKKYITELAVKMSKSGGIFKVLKRKDKGPGLEIEASDEGAKQLQTSKKWQVYSRISFGIRF